MRPSELQVGDRIITTTVSVHESCPENVEGTVVELRHCVDISKPNGFIAHMGSYGILCIAFSGAKVLRRKS
jgi:hypothetical protein